MLYHGPSIIMIVLIIVLRWKRHRLGIYNRSHDDVLVYSPALLSALLFEIGTKDEFDARASVTVRRVATNLNINPNIMARVTAGTLRLAGCFLSNPRDFQLRATSDGDVAYPL